MVEIKGFFVDYRRFPFAGVARGHYPLSIAFDGRLTEQKFLVVYHRSPFAGGLGARYPFSRACDGFLTEWNPPSPKCANGGCKENNKFQKLQEWKSRLDKIAEQEGEFLKGHGFLAERNFESLKYTKSVF